VTEARPVPASVGVGVPLHPADVLPPRDLDSEPARRAGGVERLAELGVGGRERRREAVGVAAIGSAASTWSARFVERKSV